MAHFDRELIHVAGREIVADIIIARATVTPQIVG